MTGTVIDYDKRKHAAAVLIDGSTDEQAFKVKVNEEPNLGDEITFTQDAIIHHYK